MSMFKKIREQDTETAIFGSGFDTYAWWSMLSHVWEYDGNIEAPNGWQWRLYVLTENDPDYDVWTPKVVTHKDLMRAIRLIAKGGVSGAEGQTRKECKAFLRDPELADFDSVTADNVLQVATLGEVVYG